MDGEMMMAMMIYMRVYNDLLLPVFDSKIRFIHSVCMPDLQISGS